jgi:hypothetical protein
MKIVAVVLDPLEIARLCENLGEPVQAPPIKPSRCQVQTKWDFAGGPGEFSDAPAPGEWVDPP